MIASNQAKLVRPWAEARGRPMKYPWDRWTLASRPIQLFRFIDYDIDSRNFAITLRVAFRDRGVSVRVSVAPDGGSVFVEDRP